MSESAPTGTSVDQVVQIGIVVPDARAAAASYRNLLGVAGWQLNDVDTERGIGADFRLLGRPTTARALIAWTRLGNVELELIEPRDSHSVYATFLSARGPGIHHIMFGSADYGATCERLAAAGVTELASGELQQTQFKLFDAQATLGVICELATGGELVPDHEMR